jgi:hypothetical protein
MLPPKSRRRHPICYAGGGAMLWGWSLALDRLNAALLVAALGAAAFTLASCGRNGPPLPPPGPVAAAPPAAPAAVPASAPAAAASGPVAGGPTAQETARKNGFDIFGNPVAQPGQKKSFLLDPILQ